MLEFYIPLMESFLSSDIFRIYMLPMFFLFFIATVPIIIKRIIMWR